MTVLALFLRPPYMFDTLTPFRLFLFVNSEQVCRFHFCCFHSGNSGCASNPDKVCFVYQDCKKLLGTDGSELDMYINKYANAAPGATGAGRLPTFADGGVTGDFAVPTGDEEPEFKPEFVPPADAAVEDVPVSDEVVPEAADDSAKAEPTEVDVAGLSSYAAAALYDEGGCIDDPRFSFENGPEGIKTCETFVAEVGRPAVLQNRCDREQDDGTRVKDHCRKSCGTCAETGFDAAAAALFDEGGCIDDPRFSFDNIDSGSDSEGNTCKTFVAEVGRPAVLQNRCDREQGDGTLVRDHCRKSCGNCPGEDAAAATSQQAKTEQVPSPTAEVDLEEAVLGIPPPPIRCIPEGDDEVFAEVYQDDMTDDRYDRCKRWEKKHGMTVAAYWDGHGIDSELELNVMETMVTIDKRDDEQVASPAAIAAQAAAAAPDAAPALPEPNTAGCVDDPSFSFIDGEKGDKSCATYVADVGRPAVLQNRCDHDLGSGKRLKDYCPSSCGVCEAEGARAT